MKVCYETYLNVPFLIINVRHKVSEAKVPLVLRSALSPPTSHGRKR